MKRYKHWPDGSLLPNVKGNILFYDDLFEGVTKEILQRAIESIEDCQYDHGVAINLLEKLIDIVDREE